MAKLSGSKSETRFVSAAGIAILCVFIAVLFLFLLPRDDPRVERLRQTTFDIVSPIIDVLASPLLAIRDVGRDTLKIGVLKADNTRLQEENKKLRLELTELMQARFLMQQYRSLLTLPSEPQFEMIPVRVVADPSSPFVQTLVANGGKDAGIEPGLAVMGTNGVIGRVISSGANSSRILLLTDFNSNIPVVALSSDVHAILSGRNNDKLELQFLPRKAQIKDGDMLVTSGRGGQIPIGLPVGIAKRADDEGATTVELLDDVRELIHVRIVKVAARETPPETNRPIINAQSGSERKNP